MLGNERRTTEEDNVYEPHPILGLLMIATSLVLAGAMYFHRMRNP